MHRAPAFVAVALVLACGPVRLLGTENDDDGDADDGDDSSDGRPDTGSDPTASGGDGGPGDGGPGDDDDGGPGDDGDADEGDGGDESGDPASCGNGILDPGESCDDGNVRPGDGCEADCTASPGEQLWSQTVDAASEEDAARAVMVSEGTIFIAGSMETDGNDDAWLRVLQTDGELLEDHTIAYGDDEIGTALAVAPDGTVFVAGARTDSDSGLLLRRDAVGLVPLDSAPIEISAFNALASSTAEGFVVVTHAGGFGDFTATVRRYDPTGAVLGDLAQPEGVYVGATISGADGGTILGGGTFGDMGAPGTVWLAALASDGGAQWNSSLESDADTSMRVRGLAITGDGSIVGVGTRGSGNPMNDDDTGWIWWWSASGVPQSDGPLDIGGAQTRPAAVVAGEHGLVVGGISVANDDGFVAGLALDGALQWGFQLAGDAGLEDRVTALAVVPDVGVVAVGQVTQFDTGPDAWIAMFSD